MSVREVMLFQEQAAVSSSCLAPHPPTETAMDTAGQDHPRLAGCAGTMDEETSDFITRHVLEQGAQFFDG